MLSRWEKWGRKLFARPLSRRKRVTLRRIEKLEDRSMLAAFVVSSTLDTIDANPGDGIAADVDGNTTLRAAVMEANVLAGADTITLGADVYQFTLAGNGDASLGDLNIAGTALLTIEGAGVDQTTIDAALVDRVFNVGYNSSLTLRNLSITGGSSTEGGAIKNRGVLTVENSRLINNRATNRGGAIEHLDDTSFPVNLILSNVSLANNRTTAVSVTGAVVGLGGAIYVGGATATIGNSTFSGNVGSMEGGAIYSSSSTVTINTSTFTGNSADRGGSMRLSGGNVTVNDSTFVGERARFSGGAITTTGTSLIVNRGDFEDNRTTEAASTANGGAIAFNSGGNSQVNGTEFRNNSSFRGGAVLVLSAGVNIFNSLFQNNTASGVTTPGTAGPRGGAVMVDSNGVLTALNDTFIGNTADEGAAVFVTSTTRLGNATITGNTTTSATSAAVHNLVGSFTVTNNIIAGNVDGKDVRGGVTSWGGNIIGVLGDTTGFVGSDRTGTAASPIDPLLLPLADNGGPTRTMAIASQSVARDFGMINSLTLATDARGVSRSGRAPDAGAYEYQNNPVTATVFVGSMDEDTVLHGQLQGVDLDGDPLTFETGGASFGTLVSQPNGQFTYTPPANVVGRAYFWMRASDGHGSTSAWVLNYIDILQVNDPPTVSDQTFTLDEGLPYGTFVGGVFASDLEQNYPLWGEVASGNEEGIFFFHETSGTIWVLKPELLDFETRPTHSFVVRIYDSLGASSTATMTINLNDVVVPAVDEGYGNIYENAGNGTWVSQVSLRHLPDEGQTLKYSITSDPSGGAFSIHEDFGTVTVADNSLLDFETATKHVLTVRVYDRANPALFSEGTVEVTIRDANDEPSVADQSFTVNENAGNNSAVGTVVATDADAGQTVNYAIDSSTLAGAFAINAQTGAITVADGSLLNFEDVPSATLTVSVTDNSPEALTSLATITIDLADVNEVPSIATQTFSVPENSASGTVVGTVVASDVDAGQTLTFAITSSSLAGAFAIDALTGEVSVADSSLLNFETVTTAVLTVGVTDSGNPALSDSAEITIDVADVNEAPSVANQGFTIAENSADGTVVGTVAAADVDTGQSLTYAITSSSLPGAFAIDANTGEITVADGAQLNFELAASAAVAVAVTDNGNLTLSTSATITIGVSDVNETPAIANQSFSIAENSASGTVVGTVVASDVDAGQTLTYAITSSSLAGAFTVHATTGQITVANGALLDFESATTVTLTVAVSDSGTPALSNSATITINLTNVNEAPAIANQSFSIAENSATGTVVGTVIASDVDAGQALTFAITGGNTFGAFAINSSTGRITVSNAAALDYETTPNFSLTVSVTDNGSPSLTRNATMTIALIDVDEPLNVGLDVVPGDSTNTFRRTAKFDVAILSTATFDARTVDVATVRFGKLGTENSVARDKKGKLDFAYRDVNNDGRVDLVVTIDGALTGLNVGDTLAKLSGFQTTGRKILGSSLVNVRK